MHRLPGITARLIATPKASQSPDRSAFSLIELLVVITILLVLTAVTVTSYNFAVNADRVRSGARQVQSFLAGARDKAIYAKEIRGVRFLVDPNDNHTVSAVQYVGSPQREIGTLTFDLTGNVATWNSGTLWTSLFNRGFLRAGCRIQIPNNSGSWYTVSFVSGNSITLDRPNPDFAVLSGAAANFSSPPISFALQLAPGVLGESQPVPLPRGVVIDLDGSQVPSSWRPTSFAGGPYGVLAPMDILFTPRGTVVGNAQSLGLIHLHFADAGDVLKWHQIGGRNTSSTANPSGLSSLPFVPVDDPGLTQPIVSRDRILTTLSTRTGSVSVHYVNVTNAVLTPNPTSSPSSFVENQKLADDPFSFAEMGQVANK